MSLKIGKTPFSDSKRKSRPSRSTILSNWIL